MFRAHGLWGVRCAGSHADIPRLRYPFGVRPYFLGLSGGAARGLALPPATAPLSLRDKIRCLAEGRGGLQPRRVIRKSTSPSPGGRRLPCSWPGSRLGGTGSARNGKVLVSSFPSCTWERTCLGSFAALLRLPLARGEAQLRIQLRSQ